MRFIVLTLFDSVVCKLGRRRLVGLAYFSCCRAIVFCSLEDIVYEWSNNGGGKHVQG